MRSGIPAQSNTKILFKTSLAATAIALLLSGCASTQETASKANTATTQQAAENADSRYTELADGIFKKLQAQGSQQGNQLPDMSAAALAERAEEQKVWLAQLQQVDVSALSRQNQINHRMLTYRLQNLVDGYTYKEHYMPLNAEGGFHSNLGFMVRNASFRSFEDYQNYLERLRSVPRYMVQQTAWLQAALAEGYTQPKAAMQGFEESIAAYIVQAPEDSLFFEPFTGKKPIFVTATQWVQLQEEAATIIDEQVLPAYQSYFDFMVMDYLPNSRDSVGASELPDGRDYYQNRIKHFTTLDLTPEEIHQRGLDEVKRIRNEMAIVIEQTGFEGSFEEFTDFLRTDPQFYPETAEELLKEAAYIAKKADGELPKFFKKLPRQPYGVAPVPAEIAPKYTTGRYAGSNRDDRAGFYWVNTYALDRRPLYQMEALTLHEAAPGHHLQGALAREMSDLPDYRRYTYISAFGEGWGLYAEWLGKEMGFYQDPYSDFGRLSYEMWRAARLVVDTGMHAMGWSREQAMDFMASNTALSLHNVKTEIDRYITWPGQALSYKLGEMLIRQLRTEAEQALGADFDLREFHEVILRNGSIPLDVLQQETRNWIDSQVAERSAERSAANDA
ncbi:DUF885 domain-containing protein [Pseudidiomarina gelatinasegens]|uniref:DUF885 domain-containing protein n=1 Tax=Pseudidiomarina gelatinasegens TaxID=2487740 RepID=A0A443Z7Y0_9GAMM|nr:DUF885 domain-containing protein [Pseudidiomarina gelatinasegens]RWU13042.1 DUF885 domain-containing protein [Pseudidiomarina gelatinasegens]